MNLSRRSFLFGSSSALLAAGGCRSLGVFDNPDLRFGVVSDIHVTTPATTAMFEKALRYFKSRNVDAVVVPGDLTDWGLKSGLVYVKEAWDRVFAGTPVVPLFCTGNHDFDGWAYGDMTMEMHANGYSEKERLEKLGMAKTWKEVFGEDYAGVRVRSVKGYDFVSGEFKEGYAKLGDFMKANRSRFRGTRPFFYFQHVPIKGTTGDSDNWCDNGVIKPVLKEFPNCVSITGHTHRPFNDERCIWQGEFTSLSTPSLSYASTPKGYENGGGKRDGTSVQAMPVWPDRVNLRGGQGYVVSVRDFEMCVERIDIEEDCVAGAEPWVVPLPFAASAKPYEFAPRSAVSAAPEFPEGARLDTFTRNFDNRKGEWTIVMNTVFPSAECADGGRVFDYEVKAVPADGSEPLVKRFLTVSYSRLPKYEPAMQRFWFDVAELPQDKDYRLEVRARNCFGKVSRPLVSRIWHGKPGLGNPDRS